MPAKAGAQWPALRRRQRRERHCDQNSRERDQRGAHPQCAHAASIQSEDAPGVQRRGEQDGGKAERLQGGGASRLQTALRENQWSALFIMRLVPALPFVLANLLPAMVGVRLLPFAVTTFIGIIPGTLVFTSVGAGLGKVFAEGERPDLGVIFSRPVLLPLLGLAALSALPFLLKMRKKGG